MAKLLANSGDPDQMPHSAPSDLCLHCLPITLLGVSQLQRVKKTHTMVKAFSINIEFSIEKIFLCYIKYREKGNFQLEKWIYSFENFWDFHPCTQSVMTCFGSGVVSP